jgi:threonine dehydrogenase-like Zn-dependent dehydrogenase
MKTKAVRLYGKSDLRLDEFELRPIKDDEILAKVISDSICMSTYKAVIQGSDHKRVPKDIAVNPIIIGHEFAGEIIEVGDKWKYKYREGTKFTIQPNINYLGKGYAPGYSFGDFGGDATYIIIPNVVMEKGFLLEYEGDAFYKASLAEPMSCIIAAFHASYHNEENRLFHKMGIKEKGNMAILAGAGPMGLGAIDYAIHCDKKPGMLVVTDIDEKRLKRAKEILPEEEALKNGVKLIYVNTSNMEKIEKYLLDLTEGKGYDDVFIFAPVKSVVEIGDKILSKDGCLNFFAGPTDPNFSADINFYNVHYMSTHIVGTSGGSTEDMKEALNMMGKGIINPSAMVTHIGGLNSVIKTTLELPKIPGGKKLIYTHINLELTALEELEEKGRNNPLFAELDKIIKRNNGLWCAEAEKFLLENAEKLK